MSKKKPSPKSIPGRPTDSKKQVSQNYGTLESGMSLRQWFAMAALVVVTWFAFYPSLKCEFTNWDDGTYVTENPMIWKLNGESIKEIFTTPVSLNYHPITMLSLAIDYKFSKLDPYRYHLMNVLFHIVNVLLLFIFIQRFVQGLNKRQTGDSVRPDPFNLALIVSALWAIHPMHVESVTWVAERKDVLYVLFFFLSLLFYLPSVKGNNSLLRAGFCFLFFILSCLSKGMGVVLPVVLLLIDWFYGDAKTVKQIATSVLRKAHFFLAALAFGIIAFKIQSQGAIAAMETFSLFQRLTFGCYGFIMYIYKMLLPVDLSAFYPYPFTDAHGNIPGIYYASPFIVGALLVTIVALLFKTQFAGKVLAFGFGFYFVTIVLVLQFLSVGSVIMADRYSYLSYAGLFFMVGYFFEYVRKKYSKTFSMAFAAALVVSVGALSYLTFERTKVWTNAETLWTDAMNQFPFIEIAYENRGIYYKDHGQLDKMLVDYEFVTEKLHSKNEKIWSNLGNLYGLQQKFDKSLNAYSKAIEYNPTNGSTYLNRAITLSMMGKHAESLADYDKAAELDPDLPLTYKNRAYTLLQLGQFDKSIQDYDRAIELYEYDTLSYLNRGIAKFNAKQFPGAIQDFTEFVKKKPESGQAYFNIAVSYENLGKYQEALQNALIAQKLGHPVKPEYLKMLQDKAR